MTRNKLFYFDSLFSSPNQIYVMELSVPQVHIVASIVYDGAKCPIQSHLSQHFYVLSILNYQGPTCAILKCQCWKYYRVELYHLIDT